MTQKTIIEYMSSKRGGEFASLWRWGDKDWTLGRWGYVINYKIANRLIRKHFMDGRKVKNVVSLGGVVAREYMFKPWVYKEIIKQLENCAIPQLKLGFLKSNVKFL